MSLYDFYMYLKHIEFSSENLEFYMWYKNYEASYAKGLGVINEKDYGSIGSGSESSSSVANIKADLSSGEEGLDDAEISEPRHLTNPHPTGTTLTSSQPKTPSRASPN